jgi:hypothetical protein
LIGSNVKPAEIRPVYIEDVIEGALRRKLGLLVKSDDDVEGQRAALALTHSRFPSASPATLTTVHKLLERAERGDTSVQGEVHHIAARLSADDRLRLHTEIASRLAEAIK